MYTLITCCRLSMGPLKRFQMKGSFDEVLSEEQAVPRVSLKLATSMLTSPSGTKSQRKSAPEYSCRHPVQTTSLVPVQATVLKDKTSNCLSSGGILFASVSNFSGFKWPINFSRVVFTQTLQTRFSVIQDFYIQ